MVPSTDNANAKFNSTVCVAFKIVMVSNVSIMNETTHHNDK